MKVKTLSEFKRELVKAINNQDIEHFGSLIIPSERGCPFFHPFFERNRGNGYCPDCPLSDKEGPKELMGSLDTCLLGSIRDVYWDYKRHKINEETALARLVVMSIELLGTQRTCLVGSMRAIFSDYVYYRKINKETALSMLILDATKLLAYLDNRR